jgi:hypothetical protein
LGARKEFGKGKVMRPPRRLSKYFIRHGSPRDQIPARDVFPLSDKYCIFFPYFFTGVLISNRNGSAQIQMYKEFEQRGTWNGIKSYLLVRRNHRQTRKKIAIL